MSVLETVFKIPTKAQISFLKVDASVKETHSRTATITDTEIEDGALVSDHVVLAPESVTLSCIVSDVPVSILGLGVSVDDALGAAKDFVGGNKGAFEGLVKNPRRTPKEAWQYLEQIWKARNPFNVVTALQRYENMVITNLTAPRESSNGKSLMFDIDLRKIRIIKSSNVAIPASKIKGTDKGGASKNDLGKQAGKEASAEQTDNSSLLLKGFKKVGFL